MPDTTPIHGGDRKPRKRVQKCQSLESMRLTKRQLEIETEMECEKATEDKFYLTIGELTPDQLRVALWRSQRRADDAENALAKIHNITCLIV